VPRLAFAWRFMASLLVLASLAARFGPVLVQPLLPFVKAELTWLDANYLIRDLRIRAQGSDTVVWLQVSQAQSIVLGEQVFMPDVRGRATASTLLAHVTLPIVLILCCALATPVTPAHIPVARMITFAVMRTLLVGTACILTLAIDLPFTLWASIWSLHVEAFQPDRFSPLLIWRDFLDGGGRLALAMGLGLAIAWITSNHVQHTDRTMLRSSA
jgi:hypothetical protein